jgi:CRISPR-associated Csx2 family protein
MHVLSTFLGGGVNRQYRVAHYGIEEKGPYETPLFGWALLKHFHDEENPVDKLVVFGTATSFWEHLLEVACPGHTDVSELAKMAGRGISRREIAPFAAPILESAKSYGVQEVRLEPIDFLDDTETQMAFIGQIADLLQPGDRLTLDITHGLRHQPILGTLAALVLRSAGHAEDISAIYYAALELTPKGEGATTPVLRLDPLLIYADWIESLAKAEVTGDYGPISERLRAEGADGLACNALAEGSFFHAIGNYAQAVAKFEEWKRRIGNNALRGPAALFIGEINARIDLLTASDPLSRLLADAQNARERGALVRAAELGLEAAFFILAESGLEVVFDAANPNDYQTRFSRWQNGRDWREIAMLPQAQWKQAFDRVRGMRNAMAHLDFANRQDSRAKRALGSRQEAAKALAEDFNTLFGSDLQQALNL